MASEDPFGRAREDRDPFGNPTTGSTPPGWIPPGGDGPREPVGPPPETPAPPVWQPPAAPVAAPGKVPTNSKANWSLVLGIIGLLFLPLIFSIPALLLGRAAKREIEASNGTQDGRSQANAGVILGWVGIGFAVLIFVLVLAGAISSTGDLTVD